MINLELGATYDGLDIVQLKPLIDFMKRTGSTDEEINKMLEEAKDERPYRQAESDRDDMPSNLRGSKAV